jgi:outer membrane receptor protein involved in Fe transport
MTRTLLVLMAVGSLAAPPLAAQESEPENLSPDEVAQAEEEGVVRRKEEVTVVSASRSAAKLIDAPATMSVVSPDMLETSPAQNFADMLRSVPGVNAVQTSARDINLTSRQATSTLANSQLVLVDGRSVYLDFFGLVLWDLIPTSSSNEIQQIEVVRGPASVVWGANALTGVVNIITKSPRENPGFGLSLNGGLFDRDGGSRESDGTGNSYGGSFFYSNAVNDAWSYKLSAGYFSSDPYSRPVGTVPLTCHPLGAVPCRDAEKGTALPGGFPLGGAPYPTEQQGGGNFINNGTSQPKVDLRIDQDLTGGGRITYQGGYAGTEGIIHTGIGPFDIQSGSYMAYGKVLYQKGALRFGAFGNFLDADAPNLLQIDPDNLPPEGGVPSPVVLGFKTQTFDVEFSNTSVIGGRHALTYGGNYRRNNFDITLAPDSEDRNELGAYVQEEFFLDKFRLAAGIRVDKFGNLDKAVWSPRVSVMFKPTPDQSIRASYNRAFRSPSTINNFLDQNISNPSPIIDLCATPVPGLPPGIDCPLAFALDLQSPGLGSLVPKDPFLLTVNNFGNVALVEEKIDAFELAYTGTFGGDTTISLAVYQNDIDENINFTVLLPDQENLNGLPGLEFYTPANPARGIQPIGGGLFRPITISPILMGVLPPTTFPSKVATYLNLGPLRNRGFEASIQHWVNDELQIFGNYSWQDTPEILQEADDQIRYPISEVGIPAKSRFNIGLSYNGPRILGNLSVNYADKALWTDVLSSIYHGYTDSYTMLNATIGVKFADGKARISLKGTNLTNGEILQHVYGDLLRRSVQAELSFFTR